MNNHQQIDSECTYMMGWETAEWGWSRGQGGRLVGMKSLRLGWGDSSGVIGQRE